MRTKEDYQARVTQGKTEKLKRVINDIMHKIDKNIDEDKTVTSVSKSEIGTDKEVNTVKMVIESQIAEYGWGLKVTEKTVTVGPDFQPYTDRIVYFELV